jgi:N-acetylmuramoyl-L-alanine amidase
VESYSTKTLRKTFAGRFGQLMAIRSILMALLGIGFIVVGGLLCSPLARSETPQDAHAAVAASADYPRATEARLAGDERQTRFILELDRKIELRTFALADPYRVVVDFPQVNFQLPPASGQSGRGLVKAFRFGLVMPGGSRIVMDLTRPAMVDKAYVLDAANGQPPKLVVELSATDRASFLRALTGDSRAELRPATAPDSPKAASDDKRPVVVVDPGHGGIDNGTVAATGETEKAIVLDFANALRDRLEKSGKYRVVMTRSDDTFVQLADRVKIARNESAALFVSIHADALPRNEGDAQGATIYTLSNTASDAEAARLAEAENRADVIAGIDLTEEPTDVADILIDLAQRETKVFSNNFARLLMGEMKGVVRLHKGPLKSAGFKVLKAPDVPSVLVELGYVSNKDDLHHLLADDWRAKAVKSVSQAIDAFFARRVVSAHSVN